MIGEITNTEETLVGELNNEQVETGNYNRLEYKPKINGYELKGDVTLEDIGVADNYYNKTEIDSKNAELNTKIETETTQRTSGDSALDTKISNVNTSLNTNVSRLDSDILALKNRLDEYDKYDYLVLE